MTSLEASLGALNFSTQLEEVNKLLDGAQTDIIFWGTRVVKVNGYSGSVSLENLARKTLNVGQLRCEADDLTPSERIAGVEIVRKLQKFYKLTDTQKQNVNFITRFFIWIREFAFTPYTTRFYIDGGPDEFRAYSKEKFIQQFGDKFNNLDEHPSSDGGFGPPLRIYAKEECIRAQMLPV